MHKSNQQFLLKGASICIYTPKKWPLNFQFYTTSLSLPSLEQKELQKRLKLGGKDQDILLTQGPET